MLEIILNIICLGISAYLVGLGFLHIIRFPTRKSILFLQVARKKGNTG